MHTDHKIQYFDDGMPDIRGLIESVLRSGSWNLLCMEAKLKFIVRSKMLDLFNHDDVWMSLREIIIRKILLLNTYDKELARELYEEFTGKTLDQYRYPQPDPVDYLGGQMWREIVPVANIIDRMNVEDIVRWCQVNAETRNICNNPELWKYLLFRDYRYRITGMKDPRKTYIRLRSNEQGKIIKEYMDEFIFESVELLDKNIIKFNKTYRTYPPYEYIGDMKYDMNTGRGYTD